MADPIRNALYVLLNEIDDLFASGTAPYLQDAVVQARAALAAEPPAPDPAADGELEKLARLLDDDGRYLVEAALARECQKTWELACRVIRAAVLLRQLPPKGLTAKEYFHADSGARIVREPCDGEPGWCWTVSNSRHVNPCTEFPTLAAARAELELQQQGGQADG